MHGHVNVKYEYFPQASFPFKIKPESKYSNTSNIGAIMPPSQSDSLDFISELLTATPQFTDVYN
jgi:hypothetical protein